MIGTAMLTTMFDYNAAMNARLLACAERVSAAEMDAPADMGRGSLRETLYHMVTVEWAWGHVVRDHHGPTEPPTLEASAPITDYGAFAADGQQEGNGWPVALTLERCLDVMIAFHTLPSGLFGIKYRFDILDGVVALSYSGTDCSGILCLVTWFTAPGLGMRVVVNFPGGDRLADAGLQALGALFIARPGFMLLEGIAGVTRAALAPGAPPLLKNRALLNLTELLKVWRVT